MNQLKFTIIKLSYRQILWKVLSTTLFIISELFTAIVLSIESVHNENGHLILIDN